MACGMNNQRCPNLTVLVEGNVVVVVIPLQEYFGLVTYDKNDGNYFTFREKYAIDISDLDRDCEISTISQYLPSRLTVVGRCLYPKTLLNSVFVVINTFRLSESTYFPEISCIISVPSEFVFFESETFPMGVTVFIDNGQVRFQRYSESCEPFGEVSLCTDVLRFTSVTNGIQAIYCETTAYLLDIVSLPAFQTFQIEKYGLPFFCSKSSFYSYFKSGRIYYQSITKGLSLNAGFVFNRHDMVWGACVNNAFVVMLTAKGIVFSLTVEEKKVYFIGQSQTIPRIFGTTVLMNNLTHAIVYDLYTSRQLDVIKKEFVLGYVVRNDDRCKTFAKPERRATLLDWLIDLTSGWIMILTMAPMILGM